MESGGRNDATKKLPKRTTSAYVLGQKGEQSGAVAKETPQSCHVLQRMSPRIESRNNTVHSLRCTGKRTEPQIILNGEKRASTSELEHFHSNKTVIFKRQTKRIMA